MRAVTEAALGRVIAVFGAEKPHCAHSLPSAVPTGKVFVHDGVGISRAADD
jgi:hypothetical protein